MLSDTLTKGLQKYAIGEKLRRLRLRKKMGLVELGRHTGLSSAMLSKIERARLFPTLPTLLRIAMVFNVGLEHFFTDGRHVAAVARKEDRLVFEEKFGGSEVAYRFECLDFNAGDRRLNAFYAEFPGTAAPRARTHEHDGVDLSTCFLALSPSGSARRRTSCTRRMRSILIPAWLTVIGRLGTRPARLWS